jgi:hypothetical protein
MRERQHTPQGKFIALENQFLNTFFSGLYFSATDFIKMAAENNLKLDMHSREMLIKDFFSESDKQGTLGNAMAILNRNIDERISTYHRLSLEYPGARAPLAKLAQKATGTKSLLARESRGNPYEQ